MERKKKGGGGSQAARSHKPFISSNSGKFANRGPYVIQITAIIPLTCIKFVTTK
jgi:hypothetical protein